MAGEAKTPREATGRNADPEGAAGEIPEGARNREWNREERQPFFYRGRSLAKEETGSLAELISKQHTDGVAWFPLATHGKNSRRER